MQLKCLLVDIYRNIHNIVLTRFGSENFFSTMAQTWLSRPTLTRVTHDQPANTSCCIFLIAQINRPGNGLCLFFFQFSSYSGHGLTKEQCFRCSFSRVKPSRGFYSQLLSHRWCCFIFTAGGDVGYWILPSTPRHRCRTISWIRGPCFSTVDHTQLLW